MKKELLYDSEAYYYEYIDAEDGTPIYNGDEQELEYRKKNNIPYTKLENWEYDEYMADEDYHNMLATLDEMNRGRQVKIEANLGLWDGRRHGYAYEDSFKEAFEHCLIRGDMMIEVMKTGKHTVKVKIAHHDGTNYYTLKDY